LPEVGHELDDRDWKGAGESMEATDIVSSSGVAGSRYGFVVLIKVTRGHVRQRRGGKTRAKLTMPGDVEPDCIIIECVLVGVEALERVLIARVVTIHGGVVLVTEDYP
jgi:hypothetical protein